MVLFDAVVSGYITKPAWQAMGLTTPETKIDSVKKSEQEPFEKTVFESATTNVTT